MLGEGLDTLRKEALAFKTAAFASSTHKTYSSQIKSYLRFCGSHGLVPVPASQETILVYLAFLARTLSSNSIPGYLNVIRILHLESGYKNPLDENWEAKQVQKGIARSIGSPTKQKTPITVQILLDMHKALTSSPFDRAFWSACLLAFFGFLRRSTLLPMSKVLVANKYISRGDVTQVCLSSFLLSIKASKTIQFGQKILTLPYVSCQVSEICPVRAILTHLGTSVLPASTPLFNYVENGSEVFMTNSNFVKKLKNVLKTTQHDESQISCHSFRRGGATLAFQVGMSAIDIKLRGDWASDAFEKYISVSSESALQSAKHLAWGACNI